MTEKFTINYKNNNYSFEWDKKDGRVWLFENDGIGSKSNHGQEKAARSIDEAMRIGELMLYSMGY